MTESRPDHTEFRRFHELLLSSAPAGYVPYYFRLAKGGKEPDVRGGWKDEKNRLTLAQAAKYMAMGYNIAIAGTDKDGLVIVDIDKPGIEDVKPTLRVKSRKRQGWHSFYFTSDPRCKKNIPTENFGEVRSSWQYVVSCGSFVVLEQDKVDKLPKPERALAGHYTIENAVGPVDIVFEELPSVFRQQILDAEMKPDEELTKNRSKFKSGIWNLTIQDILKIDEPPHNRFASPLHGSETGKNNSISQGLLHCWRHNVSLTPIQCLAVKAGILDCLAAGEGHAGSGAGPSKLNLKDRKIVRKIWSFAKENSLLASDDSDPYEIEKKALAYGIEEGATGGVDALYRFELSDNEWAVWTPEFLDLQTEHGHGRAGWKHVIKGYVRPIQKLVVDGDVYFQYELSRGEKKQLKVDQMAKYLRAQGAIFQGFRALDVLSAISNGMVKGEKIVHATFGVYAQEDGHLELCKDPIPVKEEQAKAWEKVSDYLTIVATVGDVSLYVEMLDFWHPYEVLPCLGLSFIAPFTPILRSKGIMVPHHFAWAPEHDLGKSRVAQMFSEKLWGHDTVSGGSISSPYRLASQVDSICLAITVEEAEKVPAQLWPMLKDVAERWLADKRGTQDLKMLDYRSRAVLFCTGNSQPINSGPTLKRFLINRFDSGARRDRRKRSTEMDRLFEQLRPIGYHAISVFLEECETVDKFIGEVRQFECALNAVSTSWASPKRPEAWACVYCGMRIFESLCRRLGLTWRVPPINEFYENVVKPVEESTWAARSTALESFLNWFSMYRVDHTKRFDGTEKIAGMDEVFSHAELTIREEHISGWWVTSALLQQYNKQAEDSEKITSLKEVAQQSADALRIPYNLVLDKDGKHARNVKIGSLTQRAAFIADTYEDYRNHGNLVTDYEPDELPNAGNEPFFVVTKLPSYQGPKSVGNLEPDTSVNSEVTRLPRKCTALDERMTGLLQDYQSGIGQSQLVEKWGLELVDFALEKGLIPRIGGNNVD